MVVDIKQLRLVPEKHPITYPSKVVYGPIISKRSYHSLGINFWPTRKVCTFDCVYCHCGKSSRNTNPEIPYEEMKKEWESAFAFHARNNPFIQDIVVEGNGEPTIFTQFKDATEYLLGLRDRFFPNIPMVLFTNSSNLDKKDVVEALLQYDQVFFKLDAVEDDVTRRIDKNYKKIDNIIDDIARISRLIKTNIFPLKNFEISTAVVGSEIGNYKSLFRKRFIETLKKLGPQKIYLYDIDRVSPGEKRDYRLKAKQVEKLARYIFKKTNIEIIALQSDKGRGIHELSTINEAQEEDIEVKEETLEQCNISSY